MHCLLRQHAMSPTNVTTLADKTKKIESCLGVGFKLFRWRNIPTCPIRIASMLEVSFDGLNGIHNDLMVWKHFWETKNWSECNCSRFIQALIWTRPSIGVQVDHKDNHFYQTCLPSTKSPLSSSEFTIYNPQFNTPKSLLHAMGTLPMPSSVAVMYKNFEYNQES